MPYSTVAELIDALRRYRLLEPDRLEHAALGLQVSLTDPQALARDLLQRGWLTPYQVNRLFRGQGAELLMGSYVLLERLGEGGMGQVFKARNWKLGKIVALKLIRNERLARPDTVRRFQREIRAAAALDHPHVIRAFDADEVAGTHFFTMEYVEGHDLAHLVRSHGPLPIEDGCEYVRQAALGLQHAHERGLVHRDIKPANLLVASGGPCGTIKILDMGLAKVLDAAADTSMASTLTQEGTVMGTYDYIAPEQAQDARDVDIRADLYSLGCTLYFLLTGQPPFVGGSPVQRLMRHQREEPQPVRERRPAVSAALAEVVHRLLAKRPEDRYQTPGELARALEQVLHASAAIDAGKTRDSPMLVQSVGATTASSVNPFRGFVSESGPAPPTAPQRRRRRWWPWVSGGAAALILGGLLLARWNTEPVDEPPPSEPPALVVSVAANRPWQDTGVDVQNGKSLKVAVRGQWRKPGGTPTGATGLPGEPTDRNVLADAAALCLLGRIGADGEPFVFGAASTFRPAQTGRLFVQANDLDLPLLVGGLEVEIKGATAGSATMQQPGFTRIQTADAALVPLQGRSPKTAAEEEQLRRDLLGVLVKYGGTPQALRAAALVRPLSSPLDQLNPAQIPPGELAAAGAGDPAKAPADLVAVLGDSRFKHAQAVQAVAFDPDGKALASGSADGTVVVWDLPSGRRRMTLKGDTVTWSPDGRRLAGRTAVGRDVVVWDAQSGAEQRAFAYGVVVRALVFSPDSQSLAVGLDDGSVKFRDVNTGKEWRTLKAHAKSVCDLCFGPPQGKRLVSASQDGTLKVWDLDGAPEPVWSWTNKNAFYCAAFSPDGKRVAGSLSGLVKLWDAETGKVVRDIYVDGFGEYTMAFSPDGARLAAGGNDKFIRIWDAATGQSIVHWTPYTSGITSLTFSRDGKQLTAGSNSGAIKIWDSRTGTEALPYAGHGCAVRSVAIGLDSTVLASGSDDHALKLWDATGKERWSRQQSDSVRHVAFRPDGGVPTASAWRWAARTRRPPCGTRSAAPNR
jgi:serine/threonine-protein kinase